MPAEGSPPEAADCLGSRLLGTMLSSVSPLTCLDVGARGGPKQDLDPLAWAVDAYCFEPDADECERLNREFAGGSAFRSLTFIPEALSEQGGMRTLRLTRRRGCSTMLEPMLEVGRGFSREDFVLVDREVELETTTLDEAASRYGFQTADYIKIDIEGLELEVLRSAPRLLASSVTAVRCEVNFLPTRKGQPSYSDIDSHLRDFGFRPVGFQELHEWRRLSRRSGAWTSPGDIPFSRGEIAHGDMLFLKHPESILESGGVPSLSRQAFIALAYGYVDYAHHVFGLPGVADHHGVSKEDLVAALGRASKTLRARSRSAGRARRWHLLRGWLAHRAASALRRGA